MRVAIPRDSGTAEPSLLRATSAWYISPIVKAETSQIPLGKREIFHLLQEDLAKVEHQLAELTNSALPLLQRINQHLHRSGGKRLRPSILLLCSKACADHGTAAIRLGAVVELIHVATLVHDDIIDNAEIRRGRPSVNATWGNDITVLAGDWMYMTAFHLALELKNFRILDLLIEVTRTLVEGELLQLQRNWSLDLNEEDHLEICSRKTACLFSACGRLAGIVAECDRRIEAQLGEYGRCLGLAFQLTDDLLDYTSDEQTLGKPVLKDLEEGKVTLPIIYLLERANLEERNFLRKVISDRDFSSANKQEIMALVRRHGTLDTLQARADRYALEAIRCLEGLPSSVYREALLRIPELVIERRS